MSITFQCPHCQAQLQAAVQQSGQSGKCPKCQEIVTVPNTASDDPPATESAGTGA